MGGSGGIINAVVPQQSSSHLHASRDASQRACHGPGPRTLGAPPGAPTACIIIGPGPTSGSPPGTPTPTVTVQRESDLALFLHLARACEQRRQSMERDKFLVLAG